MPIATRLLLLLWIAFCPSTVFCNTCPSSCQICFFQFVCNLHYPASWTVNGLVSEIPPNSFQNGANLQNLTMSSNTLQNLYNDSLNGLTNLEHLNLSHNLLSDLPNGVFQPLSSLVSLDLSNNQLTHLSSDAFTGPLTSLTTLYASDNSLTSISDDFLSQVPALTNIVLSGNQWSCQCNNTLIKLLRYQTNVTVYGADSVVCATPLHSTGSPVLVYYDTYCTITTTIPSSVLMTGTIPAVVSTTITPSPSPSSAPSSSLPSHSSTPSPSLLSPSPSLLSPSPVLSSTPSPSLTSLSSIPSPTAVISPSPSPSCPPSLTELASGILQWPAISLGHVAMVTCPYGPIGAMAIRECESSPRLGQWGMVDDSNCSNASSILHSLAKVPLTADNIGMVAATLARLQYNYLTEADTSSFIQTTAAVLNSGLLLNETILGYVFQAIDSALQANVTSLVNRSMTNMLQQAISTGLLGTNNTILLAYSNLLVGSKRIGGEDTVAMVTMHGLEFTTNTTNRTELIISYHGNNDTKVIQVTVYNSSQLFTNVRCSVMSDGVRVCEGGAVIVTPIIVVTTSDGGPGYVNITYDDVMVDTDSQPQCVAWNGSLNGGAGGWSNATCVTILHSAMVTCECNTTSVPVTVIEVSPPVDTEVIFSFMYRIVFYSCCGVGVVLHLPLILSSLVACIRHKYVRSVQALVSHSLSQCLVYLVMMLSLERWPVDGLCFTVGLLLHYTILVSYLWLIIRPIVIVLRETRRQLYERNCFIMPFTILAWTVPVIPVMIYAVVVLANGMKQVNICWLENGEFPSYFTYMAVFSVALVTVTILISLFSLVFSGYTVSTHSYVQMTSLLVELTMFSAAIGLQFATATVTEDRAIFLVLTGCVILVDAIYYFVTNGLLRPRVREVLICRSDTKKPSRQPHIPSTHTKQGSTSDTSRVSDRSQYRKAGIRHNHEMSLDYIENYLGNDVAYPLYMLQQVDHDVRRVRKGPAAGRLHKNKPISSDA